MKFKSNNIAAAVAVALMLSGLMSSPALAAKKPAAAGVGYQIACSYNGGNTLCTVERNGRHGFALKSGASWTATRGTVDAPGVVIGSYTSQAAATNAIEKHIAKYAD